ncbi:MAG: right-handed parallel beta-helix repeat-containing protein [Pseudolysinimonas sp.]
MTRRIVRAAATAGATLLVAAVIIATPTAAFAATRTVTSTSDANVAGTLRFELTNAGVGDTITFGGATFTDLVPDIISLGSSIDIPVGVTIDGPGGGMVNIVRGGAGNYFLLGLRPTIADQDYVIEGVTFDGATGTGSAMYASFNGILGNNNTARDITLTDVTATNFTAGLGGALATFQTTGSVVIEDSTLSNNHTTLGGAVSIESPGGTVTIRRNTISLNDATSATGRGGGVYLDNVPGAISISDTSFLLNDALQGGGLYLNSVRSAVTITGSTFSENTASDAANPAAVAAGGGIYLANTTDVGASLSVSTTRFTANEANDAALGFGAGIFVQGVPVLTVRSSTFDQHAFNGGGGIGLSIGGSVYVTGFIENSTFDEAGASGNAIYLSGLATLGPAPDIDIEHSTIVGPGAVYVETNQSDVDITHTILDGLGAPAVHSDAGAAIGVNWSIVSSALDADVSDDGNNLFSTAALLAPLADNGNGAFSRLPGAASPAREGGDPAIVAPPALDQRGAGFARVLGVIDIGALEQGPTAVTGSGPQLAVSGSDQVWPTLLLGLFALFAGLALVGADRRRRLAA